MKLLFPIIICFYLTSCQQETQTQRAQAKLGDVPTSQPTDRYSLPSGITLDSLNMEDTIRGAAITIEVPLSGITSLDQLVRTDLEHQRDDFLFSLSESGREIEGIDFPSFLDADLAYAYRDDKLISYLFAISFMHAGAAHPYHLFHTINFDLKQGRRIDFFDYFKVDSLPDSTFFTQLITEHIPHDIEPLERLYAFDFHIQSDSIIFDFDSYEIGPYAIGRPQAVVSREELIDKIKAEYR